MKRTVCIWLAAIFALLPLSACRHQQTGDSGPTESRPTTATTTTTLTAPAKADETGWHRDTSPATLSLGTFGWDSESFDNDPVTKMVQEITGVTLVGR